MKRSLLVVATAVALPAMAVATAGTASAARANDTTIRACQAKKTGALRVISGKKAKCRKGERRVTWNTTGPAGPTGPAPAWAGTPFMPVLLNIPARNSGPTGGQWVTIGTATFTASTSFRYRAEVWFSRTGYVVCPGGNFNDMRSLGRETRITFNGVPVADGRNADADSPPSEDLPTFTTFFLPYSGPQTVSVLMRVSESVFGTNPPPPCTMPTGEAQLQVIGYPVG